MFRYLCIRCSTRIFLSNILYRSSDVNNPRSSVTILLLLSCFPIVRDGLLSRKQSVFVQQQEERPEYERPLKMFRRNQRCSPVELPSCLSATISKVLLAKYTQMSCPHHPDNSCLQSSACISGNAVGTSWTSFIVSSSDRECELSINSLC